MNGTASSDSLTSTTAQATITIRDVNDSPPSFNKKEYEVSLQENTAPGTPLPLDMNVTDHDVGINSKFSLRLDDVSGVFEVEPKYVNGFSQVNIRVGNGTLDYENPNQRKFIVLVIAEETDTKPKLSSTATITITVLDANDNKPMFEHESYSASISEAAAPGQYVTTITAKDVDSGQYGDAGIHYSLSGTGAELFHVNEQTGVITLADCPATLANGADGPVGRQRRQLHAQTDSTDYASLPLANMDNYSHLQFTATSSAEEEDNEQPSAALFNALDINTEPTVEYKVVTQSEARSNINDVISETAATAPSAVLPTHLPTMLETSATETSRLATPTTKAEMVRRTEVPRTCLDYETETTYFLSYKVSDELSTRCCCCYYYVYSVLIVVLVIVATAPIHTSWVVSLWLLFEIHLQLCDFDLKFQVCLVDICFEFNFVFTSRPFLCVYLYTFLCVGNRRRRSRPNIGGAAAYFSDRCQRFTARV